MRLGNREEIGEIPKQKPPAKTLPDLGKINITEIFS